MTHDDWLYLIEFFLKCGDVEAAENTVKIMNAPVEDLLAIPRQRIIDAGFTPEYI